MSTRRPRQIEEALDEALSCLQRGETIQSFISAHPQMAGELQQLLALAQRLRQLGRAPGAWPFLAAGRTRLLQRAAAMRAHQRGPAFRVRRFVAAFFAPLVQHGVAATAVLLVLLAAILAGSTMMASASSLPGDPLYPVKRVAETVHLALTFDEDSRASIQQAIEERRVQEARAVLQCRRQVQLSFHGVVEAFDGTTIVAEGLTVDLQPETRLAGEQPAVGRVVAIVAQSQPDGRLLAKMVDTLLPTPVVTRRRKATPAGLRGTATATTSPAVWNEGTPTVPAEGTAVDVTPALTVEATLTCTLVPTCTVTLSPTLAITPTLQARVQLAGAIESTGRDVWRVAGQDLRITPETAIDERVAKAEVGAWVRVSAVSEPDGSLVARQITVDRPAGEPAEPVLLVDRIESLTAEQWVVGGQTVRIGPSAEIAGEPRVGQLAVIQGWRLGDDVWAASIAVVEAEQQPAELQGMIETLGASGWVVGGRSVQLDERTLVLGPAAVGCQATVRGLEQADGSVRALVIVVTAATPTPTLEPSPSPLPTPTATLLPTPSATSTRTSAAGRGGRRKLTPTATRSGN